MAKEIKQVLATVLQGEHRWKFTLLSNWHRVVGDLGTKVSLEKIYNDTLVLGVSNSCWIQELYLLSDVLLTAINQSLDQPRIKHVRFKKVGIQRKQKPKNQAHTRINSVKKITLTDKEERALEKIKDPHLSTVLKNFLIRCHRERT